MHYGPITSSATVASADATLTGLSGSTISYMPLAASDVDSDGYDDLWVANTAASSFQGIVHLVHGPFSGSSTAAAAADATITVSSTATLGYSLRLFDDVTGDSSPDLLVGAPLVSGTAPSRARPPSPPTPASTPADATATLSGTSARAFLGGAATSGDVNGDGIEDTGRLYSTFGGDVCLPWTGHQDRTTAAADVAITTSSSSDLFGNSLGSGFDHDGDGYDDILVGAGYDSTGGTNAGAAYIYNGAASAFTTTKGAANASILGSSNDYVGFEVASVEDYNNDGFGDAWVSTYVGATNGAASLFLGPVSGSLTTSEPSSTSTVLTRPATLALPSPRYRTATAMAALSSGSGPPASPAARPRPWARPSSFCPWTSESTTAGAGPLQVGARRAAHPRAGRVRAAR